MIFRAFWGEPVPEARELEQGHLAHADVPTNPVTGEVEDTDVGFPGPEHHIAEWAFPMKLAMGVLAIGATFAGLLQIPHATSVVHDFLHPTFHDSPLYAELEPSSSSAIVGMVIGTVIALAGIFTAYTIWVRRPGTSAVVRERFAGLHRLFVNRWYFDELLDALFVRPALWLGRFAQQTFERVVVDGLFVGGPSILVQAGSAAVRRAQTGFLRTYAALVVVGTALVTLYFLLA
jgi:NADH-quinone oxidoreductase subunit L